MNVDKKINENKTGQKYSLWKFQIILTFFDKKAEFVQNKAYLVVANGRLNK